MNLWHLFPTREAYKLNTFLASGLWCSDLGSIIGFGDDLEGSGLQGVFVSCWHASEGDPTSSAWEIFGGSGDGFAIRTSVEKMQFYADTFDNSLLAARMGKVQYLQAGSSICDPAFQVPEHHQHEDEMRLAITLKSQAVNEAEILKQIRQAVHHECSGRAFEGSIEQLTLSTSDDSNFALILPIDNSAVVEELLIGPLVTTPARHRVLDSLRQANLSCFTRRVCTHSSRTP